MKKKIFSRKRLLAYSLLLLSLVVSALTISGCQREEEETPITVDPITVFADGSSEYTIVRADLANNTIIMAGAGLRSAFEKRVGIEVGLRADYEYDRGDQTPTICDRENDR